MTTAATDETDSDEQRFDEIQLGVAQQRLMGLMLLFMLISMVIVGQLLLIFGLGEHVSWLLSEANAYRPAYRVGTFALAVLTSVLLYRMRKRQRGYYGALELSVAVLALSVFVGRDAPSSFPEWLAGFVGPIYIAIRGLDNLDQAIEASWSKRPGKRPIPWFFGG